MIHCSKKEDILGHWKCCDIINKDVSRQIFNIVYFDSSGKNPTKELANIFQRNLKKNKNSKIFINKNKYQNKKNP